jgi:anionic cell wall polymer biosynthesis LytR-Cps2A-Psr (LCP) family protein
MNGERALTFARSRKGNNGEGSDLMRAKRQHQILKGMIKSVENEKSIFFPFDIKEFYTEVILHTETNISLDDAIYVFSFYKNINDYKIKSLVLDDRYIYHPENAAPYGGAWVFVAKDFNFSTLHQDLENFLMQGVDLDNAQTPTQPAK